MSSPLELAFGTGSILKQLQPDFEVAGLDLSAPMLGVAAEKVPGVPLVEADMTQFSKTGSTSSSAGDSPGAACQR